jgi:hypothetical protein
MLLMKLSLNHNMNKNIKRKNIIIIVVIIKFHENIFFFTIIGNFYIRKYCDQTIYIYLQFQNQGHTSERKHDPPFHFHLSKAQQVPFIPNCKIKNILWPNILKP